MTRPVSRARGVRARTPRRAGGAVLFWLVGLCLIAVTGGMGWYFLRSDGQKEEAPLLTEVMRGSYEHVVLEQGEVESNNNVEIRCEVRARSTYGPSTSILDVISEGTWVQKGDWLITFDSSALEQEHRMQKIVVNTSEATMIEAKAAYDTAVIAKTEYLEGTYRELEQTILNEIFVAEEALKKAQLSLDSVKRLVARGLLTSLQLEGEEYRVNAAENVLQLAKRKLEVLEKYTRVKTLTQMDSDIQSARVRSENEKDNYQEELTKLKEIEDQIAKCRVIAPQEGQVVYANVQSSRSGSEFVVEAGATVRENQVVLILPDPRNMQVKAKINESRINLVRVGMPVSIRIDAFGEASLAGEVTKVNNYAEAGNWWSSSAKQYATYIKVLDPPPELRVGLTAEVRILIESRDDALQVPVQAVFEHGGKTFCLVQSPRGWDTREIAISSTNSKTVALDEQRSEVVRAGEQIVINPRQHIAKFDASRFPEGSSSPGSTVALAAIRKPDTEARATAEPSSPDVAARPPEAVESSGETSAAELSPVSQLLEHLDTDKNGRISSSELRAASAEVRQHLSSADSNHDGALDASELEAAVARTRTAGDATAGATGGGG